MRSPSQTKEPVTVGSTLNAASTDSVSIGCEKCRVSGPASGKEDDGSGSASTTTGGRSETAAAGPRPAGTVGAPVADSDGWVAFGWVKGNEHPVLMAINPTR